MQDKLYYILEKLIIKNNIQVNKEELKLQLSSHPSYPSLHALTGVLHHFNIPNLALRLVANQEILQQLPSSFIANISTDQVDDLVLIEKKTDAVNVIAESKKGKRITNDEFLKQWNGIIVAIEKDETVKETIQNPFIKVGKWALALFGILLTGYLMYSSNNMFANVHFLLSIAGLFVSVFIVKHELGLQSSAANSFCNLSQKTSCDAVLNSKGASFFGVFKLSDISIVAFSSLCCCWFLLFATSSIHFSIMSIVTLLAFPFVVYSIYYQYQVIKKWCPLCLAIASVLVAQIGVLFITGFSFDALAIETRSVALFLISVTISISVWSFLKPLLKKKKALEKVEIEHYKFKRNFSVFNVLLKEGDLFTNFTPIKGEITLGNPKAPIQIVLVTSPLCFYCKKAHSDIEQLLHKIGHQIQLTIRFNVSVDYKDNQLYKITSALLDIYNTEGEQAALKALDDVYKEDANLNHWLNNLTQNVAPLYDSIIEQQNEWCQANAINFTPALYINNKLFPKEYDRLDLMYFIDDLTEQQDTSIVENTNAIAS